MAKKKIWIILVLVSISLIIAGTVLVLVKNSSKKTTVITAKHLHPKPVSGKPKEEVWDWTFEWEATAEHLASGRQKIVGRINEAKILSYTPKVLKFKYKRPSGKIVDLTLDRDNPETEYYFGRVSQGDLYLRVWLLPDEKGNFKGQFDNGPEKISMEVFLKKKL